MRRRGISREDRLDALASAFMEPLPSQMGIRILSSIIGFMGLVPTVIGGYLTFVGVTALSTDNSSQVQSSISSLVIVGGWISIFYGVSLLITGFSILAISALLNSHAEIQLELARSRRLMAAILEVNLRTQLYNQSTGPIYVQPMHGPPTGPIYHPPSYGP